MAQLLIQNKEIIKSIQYSLSSFGIIEKDTNKLQEFIGQSLAESFKKCYDFMMIIQ